MDPSRILPGLWHGPVHWSDDFLTGAKVTHVLGVGAARKDDVEKVGSILEFLPIQDDNHIQITSFLPRAVGFIWGARAANDSTTGIMAAESTESAASVPSTRMLTGAARDTEAEPDCVVAVLLEKLAENKLDDSSFEPLVENCSIVTTAVDSEAEPAGCVYVHCNMGMSRSSAMVLAYLIAWLPAPPIEALRILRRCREVAAPNPGFLGQLALWAADTGPSGALQVRLRLMQRFQGDRTDALHRADWTYIEKQGARISWPNPRAVARPRPEEASQTERRCTVQ